MNACNVDKSPAMFYQCRKSVVTRDLDSLISLSVRDRKTETCDDVQPFTEQLNTTAWSLPLRALLSTSPLPNTTALLAALTMALAIDSRRSLGDAFFPVHTQMPASPLSTMKQSCGQKLGRVRVRAFRSPLFLATGKWSDQPSTVHVKPKGIVRTFVSSISFLSGLLEISVTFSELPSSATLSSEKVIHPLQFTTCSCSPNC